MLNISGSHDLLNSPNRKEKVLSFVEKDIFLVKNYESNPFKNKNHAIECLLPYHIFQLIPDDIKFRGSDIDINLNQEIGTLISKVNKMASDINIKDLGFTAQLLLYHEQRYINSLANQQKSSINKRKKGSTDKNALRLRLPRSKQLHVYGDIDNIHISLSKNK